MNIRAFILSMAVVAAVLAGLLAVFLLFLRA
jgi:hypothetical protein